MTAGDLKRQRAQAAADRARTLASRAKRDLEKQAEALTQTIKRIKKWERVDNINRKRAHMTDAELAAEAERVKRKPKIRRRIALDGSF